jgi:hypothetical protein
MTDPLCLHRRGRGGSESSLGGTAQRWRRFICLTVRSLQHAQRAHDIPKRRDIP